MLNMMKMNLNKEFNYYLSFDSGYYYFYSVGTFAYNKLIENLRYENHVIRT